MIQYHISWIAGWNNNYLSNGFINCHSEINIGALDPGPLARSGTTIKLLLVLITQPDLGRRQLSV